MQKPDEYLFAKQKNGKTKMHANRLRNDIHYAIVLI